MWESNCRLQDLSAHFVVCPCDVNIAKRMNSARIEQRATIRFTDDGRTLRHIPMADLILHTELRVATEKNVRSYRCPCWNCKGGHRKSIQVIHQHHSQAGRDPFFKSSLLGGDPLEGYPAGGMWVEDVAYDDDVVADVPEDINFNTVDISAEGGNDAARNEDIDPPLDEYHEVQQQVMEAFSRGDALHEEANGLQGDADDDDVADDTVDGMEELYTQATTPVYPGSKISIVSATIIIMNMCSVFRVSNKFTNELFRFFSVDLLPTRNKMQTNHYEARKSIRRLGLTYNSIHACPHG